jgi:short-subunit dehydrogenase
MDSINFSNKVVVITGASSGIGKELALLLAAERALLVIAARHSDELEKTAQICRDISNAIVLAVPTDVTDIKQCENLINSAVAEFGRIDILINNTGIGAIERFEKITDLSIFSTLMSTNFLSSVYCTHFALPFLKKTQGQIVALISLAGLIGLPSLSAYCASKYAMVGFFDTLRAELVGSDITVTAIYPGVVGTDFRKKAWSCGNKNFDIKSIPPLDPSAMTPAECAKKTLSAITKRKRALRMTFLGKILPFIKLLIPGLVDKIVLTRSVQQLNKKG